MAKTPTQLSLPQVVDLALSSPEIGTVNFPLLHSLLHVMINQLDLSQCTVEFRNQNEQFFANAKLNGPRLSLTEYSVAVGGKGPRKKKRSRHSSLVLDEKGTKDENQTEKRTSISGSLKSHETIVVVEPIKLEKIQVAPISLAVSRDLVNKIEADIADIKAKLVELTELPANIGLLEAIKEADVNKPGPVLEMFQILNIIKRMDATENGMAKLASVFEDLARTVSLSSTSDVIEKAAEIRSSFTSIEEKKKSLPKTTENQPLVSHQDPTTETHYQQEAFKIPSQFEHRLDTLEATVNLFLNKPLTGDTASKSASDQLLKGEQGSAPTDGSEMELMVPTPTSKVKLICSNDIFLAIQDVAELKEMMQSTASGDQPPAVRFASVEHKLNAFTDQLDSLDLVLNENLEEVKQKIAVIEQEIADILGKLDLEKVDETQRSEGKSTNLEMEERMRIVEEHIQSLASMCNKMVEDKEIEQSNLNILIEQIELLKITKANKEDLSDALANKADSCQVQQKVSNVRFDSVCDELSRSIEEALSKLTQQEALWSNALDEIQQEIGCKLDRLEIAPLRDFITDKLKSLQQKMKALSSLKDENEAAGGKFYLKNLQCISCDKDVVMQNKMDVSLMNKAPALAPTRNMGPYLAYELDQLRRQQKSAPAGRNLNMLENALQTDKQRKTNTHICNRYCGGSHTVTTPQQRVARIGHFLDQWGPDVSSAVNETSIRGTDGNFYKATENILEKKLKEIAEKKVEKVLNETDYSPNESKLSHPVAIPTLKKSPHGSISVVEEQVALIISNTFLENPPVNLVVSSEFIEPVADSARRNSVGAQNEVQLFIEPLANSTMIESKTKIKSGFSSEQLSSKPGSKIITKAASRNS